MNSRQGTRYIKRRMGNDLKEKILVYNGIVSENEIKKKPIVHLCPRCELVNAIDNKYCSKCSYPLTAQAFDEIKNEEDKKLKALEEQYKNEIDHLRKDLENKIQKIFEKIDISILS